MDAYYYLESIRIYSKVTKSDVTKVKIFSGYEFVKYFYDLFIDSYKMKRLSPVYSDFGFISMMLKLFVSGKVYGTDICYDIDFLFSIFDNNRNDLLKDIKDYHRLFVFLYCFVDDMNRSFKSRINSKTLAFEKSYRNSELVNEEISELL